MRTEINLSDEQIESAFDAAFNVGLTIDDVVFTRDSIADFLDASNRYAKIASRKKSEHQGYTTLELSGVQVAKGQPRRDVRVIDFGSVRCVYC